MMKFYTIQDFNWVNNVSEVNIGKIHVLDIFFIHLLSISDDREEYKLV